MNEYIIKYRIGTDWHEPHNATTFNHYTDIIEAESGKIAVRKVFNTYMNVLNNPNKSLDILSIKSI